MKISVIIPVFNEEQYLKTCLDSLIKQQEKPHEIIIVDNNSTDQSMVIVKEFVKNSNSPIKIIKEKKQGMIYARNAGFNEAQGDIIVRCDADAILPLDWLKKIKQNFSFNNIDALAGTVIFYDLPFFKQSSLPANIFIKLMKFILKHNILPGPNMTLTKKIWQKVKDEVCLDDKKVHEDIDLSIHINKYGTIKFDPHLLIYTSARRIKYNPASFFGEYPLRLIKTLKNH